MSTIQQDFITPKSTYCVCSEPEFDLDDNFLGYCVECGKPDARNDIDYSPSEPEDNEDY